MRPTSNLLNVGRITSAYGINGWLKLRSHTEPTRNIFNYHPWYLATDYGVKKVELLDWRQHGEIHVICVAGVECRNQAELLAPVDILVDQSVLAELEGDDFYWYQLQGLRVISQYNKKDYDLGVVKRLLATGANDVLVIQGDNDSIDQRERLIPYLPNQFVKKVDLSSNIIDVEWDPEF